MRQKVLLGFIVVFLLLIFIQLLRIAPPESPSMNGDCQTYYADNFLWQHCRVHSLAMECYSQTPITDYNYSTHGSITCEVI